MSRVSIGTLVKIGAIIVAAAIVLSVAGVSYYLFGGPKDLSETPFDGDKPPVEEKVPDGSIHISMNSNPVFKDGVGNVNIENSTVNNYPQVVEIIRNDNEQLIFRSEQIPIGEKLETAKLTKSLSKGDYDCTAIFYNIGENGEDAGCAAALITVTVE